jgi:hypothetical protein
MVMNRLLFLYLALIALSSCSSTQELQDAFYAQVREGMTRSQVLQILGSPSKERQYENYRLDGFCRTGWASDVLVDVFYKDNIAFRKETYTNTEGGLCSSFFRNHTLSLIKELNEERLAEREAEREREERAGLYDIDEYFIDGLVAKTILDRAVTCISGGAFTIEINGSIGADSSFALEELLKLTPHCLDANNQVSMHTSVVYVVKPSWTKLALI